MHFKQFKASVPKIDLAQLCLSGAASHQLRAYWKHMPGTWSWRRQLEREATRTLGTAPVFQGTFVICIIGNLITASLGRDFYTLFRERKLLAEKTLHPRFLSDT